MGLTTVLGLVLMTLGVGVSLGIVVERFLINPSPRRRAYLMEASGPISDRLRKQFPDKNDPGWNPPRDESEPEAKPLPKGRDGWSITGRGKKA